MSACAAVSTADGSAVQYTLSSTTSASAADVHACKGEAGLHRERRVEVEQRRYRRDGERIPAHPPEI